jgi:hypothetical protein
LTKIRRSNFVFVAWKGDHLPRHVHVYRGRRLVLKWDIENRRVLVGTPTRRILKAIASLMKEGRL